MNIIVPCPGCFDNVSIPWKPDYVVSTVVCGCGEWITLGKDEAERLIWEQALEERDIKQVRAAKAAKSSKKPRAKRGRTKSKVI